jgi:hypothetical protein
MNTNDKELKADALAQEHLDASSLKQHKYGWGRVGRLAVYGAIWNVWATHEDCPSCDRNILDSVELASISGWQEFGDPIPRDDMCTSYIHVEIGMNR